MSGRSSQMEAALNAFSSRKRGGDQFDFPKVDSESRNSRAGSSEAAFQMASLALLSLIIPQSTWKDNGGLTGQIRFLYRRQSNGYLLSAFTSDRFESVVRSERSAAVSVANVAG